MAPGKHGHDDRNSVLRVDPEAVPALRTAFANALAKVDRQLELAGAELRVAAWAKDPVSQDATALFNDRSVDGEHAALDALRAFRVQLDVAVANLDRTAEQYAEVDGDGKAGVNKKGAQ